jgi:hypothetical protein
MMHATFPLAMTALALSACAAPAPQMVRGPIALDGVQYNVTQAGTGKLTVRRIGKPFANWEGAEAYRAASQFCNGRAKSTIRDTFQAEAWVIYGGCV